MSGRVAFVAGSVVVAIGILGVLAPGLFAGWTLSTAAVVGIGVVAGLFALRAANRRRRADVEYATLPRAGGVPEEARRPPAFAQRVTADVERARPARNRNRRERFRERLQDDVVAALVARGEDPDAARDAVREGTWTTDPYAAAFLSPERSLPVGAWLRLALAGGTFEAQVAHVGAELDRLTEVA